MQIELREIHLKGIPVSSGVAMGHLFCCGFADEITEEWTIPFEGIDDELSRYREALAQGREDLTKLLVSIEEEPQGAAILNAHLQLLRDPAITCDIEHEIRRVRKNAEFVLQQTIVKYQKKFSLISNPFFRERFYDLQTVIKRILDCLKGKHKRPYSGERGIVFYTRELSFIELSEVTLGPVKGFITECNSVNSHASIIANARGIPFVTSIPSIAVENNASPHAIVIVDGNTGDVFIHPSEETLDRYLGHASSVKGTVHVEFNDQNSSLHAETYDGYRIQLSANIEMAAEAKLLHRYGGGGVGLFRSECAFLSHGNFPNEEEQFLLYKEAIESMKGMPFVIRVFDLGGDKYMLGQKISFENNPFLGCRAIRFLLREKLLFKMQLKAILRASAYGNMGIMFPMVSSLTELLQAKELLAEARKEVEATTEQPIGKIRIGCMIEVPSAALMADVLAKECDFLSIGTNDLVQYVLAVDRSNYALSSLYTPYDPSIIRLIKLIVNEANCSGIPVSVCGEIAANPKFTPLLLGLGVHELSMALRYLVEVKEAIRKVSILKAVHLAEEALSMASARDIETLIESFKVFN